mgnify:CR=1 FL=1
MSKINILVVASEPPPTRSADIAALHQIANCISYNQISNALESATGKTAYDLIVIDPEDMDEIDIRNLVANARAHLQDTRGFGPTIVTVSNDDVPDDLPSWADFKVGTILFENHLRALLRQ